MWCWTDGAISGWGIVGIVLMVIFWIAVIVLVIWGIKRLTQRTTIITSTGTPLEVAKERYARGEISKEEFEEIKNNLS
ncbi:SHOCT domain-containing protein [Chloroflexota bacterium]